MHCVVKCSFFNIRVGVSGVSPLTLHLCYYLAFSEVCTCYRNSRIFLKNEDRCQTVNSSFGSYPFSNPPFLLQLNFLYNTHKSLVKQKR